MIKREELTNTNSCMSRARDDEMTFVLLGRDPAAPMAIRAWVSERIRIGKNTFGDPQIKEAIECGRRMELARADEIEKAHSMAPDPSPGVTSEQVGAELCPSCLASDSVPYENEHGAKMRACGRCMIQWAVTTSARPELDKDEGGTR